jgi:hypothetical protein
MIKDSIKYFTLRFSQIISTYQSLSILVGVILGVILLDLLVGELPESWIAWAYETIDKQIAGKKASEVAIDFAPEAWLSLLGLVLGTLIVVISVASQSTPKLIDLYTRDRTSLYYIWYIVVCSVHNMYLQLFSKIEMKVFETTMLLNTYILLPIALMLAVPYVLYILRYTKTSNVIAKISKDNLRRILQLRDRARFKLLDEQKEVAHYQFELFEALNQLDNLLEYVSFKEPKGDIINKISLSIQTYTTVKADLLRYAPDFFKISPKIGTDVSFKTMTEQFLEMERTYTFYEQKGFRLLGNTFQQLMEDDDFDLASLCAYELSECGRVAVECNDQNLIEVVLVRFNTLLRFGIKHGLKNKEARNLYNAIFHYSSFISYIVRSKNEKVIRQSCMYLNIYVNEIHRHSREEPAFIFLVDAFTWEFKRTLIELNKNNLDIILQKDILGLFLRIDNLSDSYEEAPVEGRKYRSGLRGLQIALALYYLRENQGSLAESIIIDILSDHEYMDKEVLKESVFATCENLRRSGSKFWEDTDRGNYNLYFSEDKEQIDPFKELFGNMLDSFALLVRKKKPSNPD